MPVRLSSAHPSRLLGVAASALIILATAGQVHAMWQPGDDVAAALGEPAGHLVVSELLTGGAGASDEFVELFNPSTDALPLEGLEVVYVTASGATVTRKAAWDSGAPDMPAGSHLLVANEAGAYAAIADATYAGGLAATGGSVAIRIQGASTPVDAVGWGSTVSAWVEGTAAPAPSAGASLERLPGGSGGSFQDTDDNLVDFVERAAPDPQNGASPIITPSTSPSPATSPSPSTSPSQSATASATPTSTPDPTPSGSASSSPTPTLASTPTPTLTPAPSPDPVISIADARLLPDGATVTVGGVSLSDSAFSDGGGYLADETGGIAVLLADGAFARDRALEVRGVLDTRYQQRTLRASGADAHDLGTASEPDPLGAATGNVGEGLEAILVRVEGEIVSAATALSSGVAFDVDDGSGPIRVLVMTATGIDTTSWTRGTIIAVVGIVGQRDATGTGTSGYRVQPRGSDDIAFPAPPPTPTPSPTASASPVSPSPTASPSSSATPSPVPGDGVISIAAARAAAANATVRVRGVVTMADGLVDPTTAVIQDPSGGIVLRLGDEAGSLRRGQLVEVTGKRSTKSGMQTIRVSVPPVQLGTQAEPVPMRGTTTALGEDLEASLVVTRGALTAKPRRSTAGSVSFAIDDGSGELRVVIYPAARIDVGDAQPGTWIEIRGVLGQDTTGSQPLRGYRIWPRSAEDLTLLATPPAAAGTGTSPGHPTPHAGAHGPGPSDVRLTALDGSGSRSSALGGGGAASSGQASVLASRSSADPSSATASAHPAAGVTASRQPAQRDAVVLLGILGLALAALGVLAYLGWRDGALGRLRWAIGMLPGGADAAAEPDGMGERAALGDVTQALPRLSVIRVPHEPGGS